MSDQRSQIEQPTEDELIEALQRSGYVMESRLVQVLTMNGYFVEPNQRQLDTNTGKSREIDIIAEGYYDGRCGAAGVCVKTQLAIEAINTAFPLLLLTEKPFSPNDVDYQYYHYRYTDDETKTMHRFHEQHEDIIESRFASQPLYAQYCGFSRKKSSGSREELMASHPDSVFTGIEKTVQYVSEALVSFDATFSKLAEHRQYCRLFYWAPVIVTSGELFVVDIDNDGKVLLIPKKHGRHVHYYHYEDRFVSAIVDIVTEKAFPEFLNEVREMDTLMYDMILEVRMSG